MFFVKNLRNGGMYKKKIKITYTLTPILNVSVYIRLGFFPSCVITYSVNISTNI